MTSQTMTGRAQSLPKAAGQRVTSPPIPLVNRFHETNRFKLPGPHPEEPRSQARTCAAERGVSKDGRESIRCGHPSRRIGSADAPQDEVQGTCRYDSNFGNAVLGDLISCAPLRRPVAPRLWQLFIIAAVTIQLSTANGIAGGDAASPVQSLLGPDVPAAVELAPLTGNPIAEVPLDRLSATRDRPLFSPGRRPTVAPQPPPARPRIEHAPPSSPVQSPTVTLFGIVVGSHGPRAFIGRGPTDPIVGVRPGDDVNGWMVSAITERSLVLSHADLTATFVLFSPENASRVAHFESAAPSQQIQRPRNDGHPRIRIR